MRRRVTGESRLAEVWVARNEVVGSGVEVGEVAAAAAGDSDLFSDAFSVFQYDDTATAFAGFNSTEEAGGTAANYYDVFLDHAQSVALNSRQKAENRKQKTEDRKQQAESSRQKAEAEAESR